MTPLTDEVRELLACPRCHGVLTERESALRCDACRVVYPVEDGVAVLLIEAGLPVEEG